MEGLPELLHIVSRCNILMIFLHSVGNSMMTILLLSELQKSNHGHLGHLHLMQLRDFVRQLTPCVSPTLSANRMHCCVVQLLEIPESTVYGKLSNLHHQTPRLTLRTPTGKSVAEQGRQTEAKETNRSQTECSTIKHYRDAQRKHQASLLLQITTGGEIYLGVCSYDEASKKQNTNL